MPFTDIKPRSELTTLKELRLRQPTHRLPLTPARRQLIQLINANPDVTCGDIQRLVPSLNGIIQKSVKWLILHDLIFVSGHKPNGNAPQINRYSLTDEGRKYLL